MGYQSDFRGYPIGDLIEHRIRGGADDRIGGAVAVPGHDADIVLDGFAEIVVGNDFLLRWLSGEIRHSCGDAARPGEITVAVAADYGQVRVRSAGR